MVMENGKIQVPIKTLLIDGNCRVEDRGLKTHHGLMVYVLSVYNKKEKYHRITMAAFNIQEALIWKEKIQFVIDQHQESQASNGNKYVSFEYKSGMDNGRAASSSDHESQFSAQEDEEVSHPNLLRRTTVGKGDILLLIMLKMLAIKHFPESIGGCCNVKMDFAYLKSFLKSNTLYETNTWDCTFQYGSLVEEVDGHTAVLYHRLQLDWFSMFVWPRDLCYVRYWRRNDDGSYVVLFRSREHENCGSQPGYVRAHIESGGFNISPLKPRNGRPRSQVQHLIQIDLKGWGVGYVSSFQQHCLLQMLNSVAGLREWFAQSDERGAPPRIPVMVNMASASISSKKSLKMQDSSAHHRSASLDQMTAEGRNSAMMDEYSDEDEEFQIAEEEQENLLLLSLLLLIRFFFFRYEVLEEPVDEIDHSWFSGNLRYDERENGRDCWKISEGNNFRVRSRNFCFDKTKIPAGKHLMDLVAVDWFKDTKRMDHVARRQGCAAQVASEKGLFSVVFNLQVPGSTHYSMVFYFVTKALVPGSLLERFVDGDDEFRNSRCKLIPSVPKGSWIVRQSVGSTPCLLGKAVDCNYIRGPKYLEVDVDIGSSTVANGVLGLVIGVITTLVVDMAFLVQANTTDELPERLIGAVRVSHIQLSSAIVPNLDPS
ncbi:Protein ENHANCED DISEASE RESISTANCE 2 [Linum perenne]